MYRYECIRERDVLQADVAIRRLKANGQVIGASCYLVDLRSVCSIASAFISPTRTITKLVISTAMANGIQWQKSNRQRPKDSVRVSNPPIYPAYPSIGPVD